MNKQDFMNQFKGILGFDLREYTSYVWDCAEKSTIERTREEAEKEKVKLSESIVNVDTDAMRYLVPECCDGCVFVCSCSLINGSISCRLRLRAHNGGES